MRKEDKEILRKALYITKRECALHENCDTCTLYNGDWCILETPPDHIKDEVIEKCFT